MNKKGFEKSRRAIQDHDPTASHHIYCVLTCTLSTVQLWNLPDVQHKGHVRVFLLEAPKSDHTADTHTFS